MSRFALFLLFGLLAPTTLNIGMGMQKYGVWAFSSWRQLFKRRDVTVGLWVWTVGTLLACSSMVFGFLALSHGGSPSTLGALGGFGVVVLTLFSRFVLKERITPRAVVGVVVVVVGTSVDCSHD